MDSSAIKVTNIGSRTLLTLNKSLTFQNCDELSTLFKKSISPHEPEIILCCKSVEYLDSEALNLLVQMHETLAKQGGMLKIISLNDVCRDILFVTRLLNVFHVYKNINDAIKNLS